MGVAAMVQQRFKPDPFTNTLFLLCGRRLDCIRSSAGTGMDASCCISYKRLEQAHTNGRKTKRRYGG